MSEQVASPSVVTQGDTFLSTSLYSQPDDRTAPRVSSWNNDPKPGVASLAVADAVRRLASDGGGVPG